MNKLYILVAEDDEEDREIMGSVFSTLNCPAKMIFVEDGEKLLEHLATYAGAFPGLILTDLNMPRLNGKQVLKSLKEDSRYKHIPVVVFSTSAWREDVQVCYRAGASTFISKPDNIEGWADMLGNICSYWFHTALLPAQA
jgi:CheY-like chemotaxis protein